MEIHEQARRGEKKEGMGEVPIKRTWKIAKKQWISVILLTKNDDRGGAVTDLLVLCACNFNHGFGCRVGHVDLQEEGREREREEKRMRKRSGK